MIHQNDVKSPKSIRHSSLLVWTHSGGQDEIKNVELVIETAPVTVDPRDKINCSKCVFNSLKGKMLF